MRRCGCTGRCHDGTVRRGRENHREKQARLARRPPGRALRFPTDLVTPAVRARAGVRPAWGGSQGGRGAGRAAGDAGHVVGQPREATHRRITRGGRVRSRTRRAAAIAAWPPGWRSCIRRHATCAAISVPGSPPGLSSAFDSPSIHPPHDWIFCPARRPRNGSTLKSPCEREGREIQELQLQLHGMERLVRLVQRKPESYLELVACSSS